MASETENQTTRKEGLLVIENEDLRKKYGNSLGHILPQLQFHKIPDDYEFPNVDPYEPRKFPLTDEEHEKLIQEDKSIIYNNSGPLKTHIEIMHKGLNEIRQFENKNVIKCKDCDSIFTGKNIRQCESNLKIHIRHVHEGKRIFSCSMCEKAFWHPYALNRHINCVHYKMKSSSCNHCGKSFSEPAYLKKHKCRIHKCDSCEKVCTEKTFLRHIEKCQKKKVVKKS